jgi:hypothetical protein
MSSAVLMLAMAAGCDENAAATSSQDQNGTQTSPAAPGPSAPPAPLGSGVIRGKVLYNGTPPTPEVSERPCHSGPVKVTDESVVVSAAGEFANVIVYLEEPPATSDGSSLEPKLLDQVNCVYSPHVLALQTNQKLRVRSSDATLHNVHYDPKLNPSENFGMTGAGQERVVSFKLPEFIRVRCDVHPWMSAWIGVFDHSYFAVSGPDGSFEIAELPEGEYTLVAWHERLGKQQLRVTVEGDEPAAVTVTYQAP